MKKTLVVLLILAVAGGVFAQEITWSGSIATGLYIDMAEANDDPIITGDDDDAGTPVQARLHVAVADDAWGIELGIGANIDNLGEAFLYDAHGWILFADMIKVRAGLIDPGVWNTAGPEDWNFSSGGGVRLEIMPIEGLNIGAFLNFNGISDGRISDLPVQDFFKNTVIGFSYANEDIMGLYAALAFKLAADETAYQLIFGLGLSPMEALGVKIEVSAFNLGKFSDAGWLWFVEDISYKVMDNFKAGIELHEQIVSKDSNPSLGDDTDCEGSEFYLKAMPYAEFGVNENITVGGDIPLEFWKNSAGDFGFATLGLDLWVKYAIEGNASLKLGYGFVKGMKDYAGDKLDHSIRLLFNYSF
jgi:hypothetical protein